jgi:hypothetical protein
MRLRAIVPLLVSLVAVVSACGAESTQPPGEPSTLSFTYSGYRSGTYSATGFLPDVRTGMRWITPWASGDNFSTVDSGFTGLTASMPVAGANHIAAFVIPFGVTGTFTLSAHAHERIAGDALIFNFKSGVSNGEVFLFSPGTITVTSSTADRVAGTFSGTAIDTLNHRTVTVTNGSFDVHIDRP